MTSLQTSAHSCREHSAIRDLKQLLQVAVDAVRPAQCMPPVLHQLLHEYGNQLPARTIVIGAGKAAAAMAQSVEQLWPGPVQGMVITRYGHALPCQQIEVVEAAHPIPDQAGYEAAQRLLQTVQNRHVDDLVICLLSGGGSALMSLPSPCVNLEQKREINRALLRSGATIHDINCVRKHLSAIKGGRLALACAPARVVSLIISDVAGDDAAVIASGPTLVDDSSSADALAILRTHHIKVPPAVEAYLMSPQSETPKQFPATLRSEYFILARAQTALEAAAKWARDHDMDVHILSDRLQGEAKDLGRQHAQLARSFAARDFSRPQLLLSGGETTVRVLGQGRGGRNTEYLLSLCMGLQAHPQIYALAADTDGIDGSEDNAGAWIAPNSLLLAHHAGLQASEILAQNDAYRFFEAIQALVVTGPTLTNVNDFRAILILPK